MRRPRMRELAALLLATAMAGAAGAVTFPVSTELRLEIHNLPPLVVPSNATATVNGSGAGGHLDSLDFDAGAIGGSAFVDVTDPQAFPIKGLRLAVANAAGGVAETNGRTLVGTMGLPGVTRVCLFGPCSAPIGNLDVPLTPVGQGGAATATAAVNLTVIGAPWTSATTAIGTITRMGFAHGPASAPYSTARAGGVLQLVTPVFVSTNIAAEAIVPVFATLRIEFVPEPATLAALGFGIAWLGWAGRRRRG